VRLPRVIEVCQAIGLFWHVAMLTLRCGKRHKLS
jgi:hypothetical protein